MAASPSTSPSPGFPEPPPLPASRRLLAITVCVVLLHAASLWALIGGPRREPPPAMVPVTLVEGMAAAARPAPPPAPAKAPTTAAVPDGRTRGPGLAQASAVTAPAAAAAADATAAATAPVASTPQATQAAGAGRAEGPPLGASPPAPSPGSANAGAAASARLELPASEGGDLRNPKPPYPPQSRRLGEQGQVVVRVLVGPDGLAQRAQIHQSSGYTRLDQAALATVLQWQYVPGRRGGLPEAMWFNVPVNFVLE